MGQGQRPGRARRNIRHCFGGHVAFGGLGLPIGITLAASEAKLGPLVQLVSKQNRRRNKVKRQRRFGTEVEAASAAAQIKTLIDSLSRCQQSLDCDIATEEERTRCSDDSDPAYSVFARSLIPRRDNVAATIAILQARLSKTELPTSTGIGSVPVQLLQPA